MMSIRMNSDTISSTNSNISESMRRISTNSASISANMELISAKLDANEKSMSTAMVRIGDQLESKMETDG